MTGRADGEAGETLIEVMMTVAIVGIALVSIISGVGAAIRFSGAQRSSADGGLALVLGAEAVKGWSGGPLSCGALTVASYAPALAAVTGLPAGWTTGDLSIRAASCVSVGGVPLPRVTVVATSPDGWSVQSLDVTRRSLA